MPNRAALSYGPMVLGTVDEVVVDCARPRELAVFWAGGLGGQVHERDQDWVYIRPPNWTQLSFQRVPERKSVKNRLHIDVCVADMATAAGEAIELGAHAMGTVQHTAAGSFQVMLDPEGNEWCLVRPH